MTWQNGEVCRGREEVRAFYHRMMSGDKRIVREITSAPEVIGRHVYGDWTVSWGNLHEHSVLMDGSDLPLNSVFTATLAKRGDNWVVTAFHASVNVFDNPVLKLGIRKTSLYVGLAAIVIGLIGGFAVAQLFRRKSDRHCVTCAASITEADAHLKKRASAWFGSENLSEIVRAKGLDFATAVLHDRILRVPENADFL